MSSHIRHGNHTESSNVLTDVKAKKQVLAKIKDFNRLLAVNFQFKNPKQDSESKDAAIELIEFVSDNAKLLASDIEFVSDTYIYLHRGIESISTSEFRSYKLPIIDKIFGEILGIIANTDAPKHDEVKKLTSNVHNSCKRLI